MANDTKIRISAETAQAEASLRSLSNSVGGLARSFAPLTAALSVTAMAAYIKSSIDAANTLDDLSQATGTSVETLAGLDYAARQNGASLETVARGGQKLSAMMADKPEIFKKLGISATDSTEAMIQLSDVFADMPDGVDKSALATKLFGDRLGGEMILFLNQGTEAMRKNIEIGKEYNPVTSESAAQAAKFNDNLDALKMSAGTFGVTLANGLLPALSKITSAMKDTYKESGLLAALWVGLGGAGAALFTDDMLEREDQIIKRLKEINELQSSGRALPGALRRADAEKPALEAELKQIKADREKLKSEQDANRQADDKRKADAEKRAKSLAGALGGGKAGKELGDGTQVLLALELDYQNTLAKRKDALNAPLLSVSEKALADDLRDVHKRAQDARVALEKQNTSGSIGAADYSARLSEVTAKEQEQVSAVQALQAAQDQLNGSWEYGAKVAMRNYIDEATNTARLTQGLFSNAFKGMEDALVSFVQTGKLDFASLRDSIISDLLRIQTQKALAGVMGSLFGSSAGFGSNLTSTGQTPGGYTGIVDGLISSGGRASGGPVSSNSLYKVNEKGPELLNYGGSDYLMMGGKGGFVKPVTGGVGGGKSIEINYAPSISIDARADSAQIEQMVSRQLRTNNAELVDTLQRQRVI